ncbi:hypothetical protein LOD99_3813 [Oopsacas minuta]|uniref:Uncharacterized protein n=1 Tax=Oopsacas minuta TaxID=111878 RepID=A0AAV7JXR9_9METZ|nr:hypothetical protein LOD99_3813 [Oopsacas minuta]
MAQSTDVSEYNPLLKSITPPIPIIPLYKSIIVTSDHYTKSLRKRLGEIEMRPQLDLTDATLHPYCLQSDVQVHNALYLGTKNSASNSLPAGEKKVTIGIYAQLQLGVRFLDFEVTTLNSELQIVCNGIPLMTGKKLFEILKRFVDEQNERHNKLGEKILLNFRECECKHFYLLPTLELLSDLIKELPPSYLVKREDITENLSEMDGVFIIFGPIDLNLALNGTHAMFNWGSNLLVKVQPRFNGDPSCILQWITHQKRDKFEAFPIPSPQYGNLVWLDISDPLYRGEASHEVGSMKDGGLLFPTEAARFNIISFGSLNSMEITLYMKCYRRQCKNISAVVC